MPAVLRKTWLLGLCGLLFCPLAFGQEDTPCSGQPSSKAAKLLEKGTDKRKYDIDKRRGYLEDAREEDDTSVEVALALGLLLHILEDHQGARPCQPPG